VLPATGVFWPWHLHRLSDSTLDTCTCTCTGGGGGGGGGTLVLALVLQQDFSLGGLLYMD